MNRERRGLSILPLSLLLVACAHGQPPPEGAEAVAPVEDDLSAFDEDAPPEDDGVPGASEEGSTQAAPQAAPEDDAAPADADAPAAEDAPAGDAAAPDALAMAASKKKSAP